MESVNDVMKIVLEHIHLKAAVDKRYFFRIFRGLCVQYQSQWIN